MKSLTIRFDDPITPTRQAELQVVNDIPPEFRVKSVRVSQSGRFRFITVRWISRTENKQDQ